MVGPIFCIHYTYIGLCAAAEQSEAAATSTSFPSQPGRVVNADGVDGIRLQNGSVIVATHPLYQQAVQAYADGRSSGYV
jgi:hypothetical protein